MMSGIPMGYSHTSAWSSVPLVQDARSKIDDELAALHVAELQWKTRRNALSRVCVLPSELLSLILLLYREDHINSPGLYSRQLSWIRITHVCRHWRDVALSCPALWARLTCTSLPLTEEMIRRSGTAPLYVSLNLTYGAVSSGHPAYERALDEISRVRELHLVISRQNAGYIMRRLTIAAPLLRSLTITTGSTTAYVRLLGQNQPLVSNNFLGRSAPSLRELKVHNCDISWDFPVFATLTELDLAHISPEPTYPQLLNILRNAPALRNLSLEETLPTSSAGVEENVVHLPGLQHLRVSDSPVHCAELLARITFPSTTSINLCCTADDNNYSSIFPFLAQRCVPSSATGGPYESLQIWSNGPYGYSVKFGFRTCSMKSTVLFPDIYNTTTGWSLLVELKSSTGLMPTVNVLTSMFVQLTPTNVIAIQIKGLYQLTANLCRSILACAPKTRVLDIDCTDPATIQNFISVLQPHPRARAQDSHPTSASSPMKVRLRHLKLLALNNVEFEKGSQGFSEICPSISLDTLCDFLIARVNADAGLLKINLRNCFNFYRTDKLDLQEIVPYVIWDGIEQEPHDDDEEEEVDDNGESSGSVHYSDDEYYHPRFVITY